MTLAERAGLDLFMEKGGAKTTGRVHRRRPWVQARWTESGLIKDEPAVGKKKIGKRGGKKKEKKKNKLKKYAA
jgi:hypothetical protein